MTFGFSLFSFSFSLSLSPWDSPALSPLDHEREKRRWAKKFSNYPARRERKKVTVDPANQKLDSSTFFFEKKKCMMRHFFHSYPPLPWGQFYALAFSFPVYSRENEWKHGLHHPTHTLYFEPVSLAISLWSWKCSPLSFYRMQQSRKDFAPREEANVNHSNNKEDKFNCILLPGRDFLRRAFSKTFVGVEICR